MEHPISFERQQRLRLRLRGQDRELSVEVTAVAESTMWVRVVEPAIWLEDHHLESGLELSCWVGGVRHIAEPIKVLAFDLDRGRLRVVRPRETRIVQRRKTFRELVELPVRLASVERGAETLDLAPLQGKTQDLSGGGLCVATTEDLNFEVDDEIQLELALPEHKVRARGRVRWAERQEGHLRLGVAFTRIGEREQDQVYGFLFDVQRSRLRASA